MHIRTRHLSGFRYAALACLALGGARTASAQVTMTNDRAAFAAVLGVPLSVETFTSSYALALGPTLDAATSVVPGPGLGHAISPGDILPGVTYSVASGSLNIDEGGHFPGGGGFLDACRPASGCLAAIQGTNDPLVVTFHQAVRGFGFDANVFGGEYELTVGYAGGSFTQRFTPGGLQFFGFYRQTADITSASLVHTNAAYQTAFAVDNFTFPTLAVTAVPEPGALALLAGGLGVLGAASRRRRRS